MSLEGAPDPKQEFDRLVAYINATDGKNLTVNERRDLANAYTSVGALARKLGVPHPFLKNEAA